MGDIIAEKIYSDTLFLVSLSDSVYTRCIGALMSEINLAPLAPAIEFYSLLCNEPVERKIIRVCTDQACALKNADGIFRHLCGHHALKPKREFMLEQALMPAQISVLNTGRKKRK
jgi:hypothetical protein